MVEKEVLACEVPGVKKVFQGGKSHQLGEIFCSRAPLTGKVGRGESTGPQ